MNTSIATQLVLSGVIAGLVLAFGWCKVDSPIVLGLICVGAGTLLAISSVVAAGTPRARRRHISLASYVAIVLVLQIGAGWRGVLGVHGEGVIGLVGVLAGGVVAALTPDRR